MHPAPRAARPAVHGINDTLEGKTLDPTGGMLSLSLKSSAGSAVEGYFSIRIVDNVGDAYRSPFDTPAV